MPVVHRLRKRVRDTSAHADQRCLFDTKLGRNLVGRAETDAADLGGQAVRVF